MYTHTHSPPPPSHARARPHHPHTPYPAHTTLARPTRPHRIPQARLWIVDPPTYYNPQGGLMTYDSDLPARLTTGFTQLHGRNLRRCVRAKPCQKKPVQQPEYATAVEASFIRVGAYAGRYC